MLVYGRNVCEIVLEKRLKKISLKHEATPSNTVPFFGSEKKLRWSTYDLPKHVENDNKLNEAFFLPKNHSNQKNNVDMDAFLKDRLLLLCQKEKKFVEELGLEYGE